MKTSSQEKRIKKAKDRINAKKVFVGQSKATAHISHMFLTPLFHILIILTLSFIAYSNTLNAPFHFDDARNIVNTSTIRDIDNLWPLRGTRDIGFLSFAVNYKLNGLDVTGYHVVNLAIHSMNALLVYLLVLLTFRTPRMLQDTDLSQYAVFMAFFSSLLFVCHPVQTQAVTYIVQRLASLATFFYLLSLVLYIKARLSRRSAHDSMVETGSHTREKTESNPEKKNEENTERMAGVRSGQDFFSPPTVVFYSLSLVSAIIAMKTKEISFTLPVVITLYEFFFFEGNVRKKILYLIPMLLTMLIIPLSLIGTDRFTGGILGDMVEAAELQPTLSRSAYLLTQFRVIVSYIRLLVLPVNQNLDYDYPAYHVFLNYEVFLSFLFLASIFCLGISLFYRSRHVDRDLRLISFGVFWFFITLSVESSIIPIKDVIFEHRLYLPSVGAFIGISTLAFVGVEKLKKKRKMTEKVFFVFMVTIVFLMGSTTYVRNSIWKEDITLWSDVTKKSPQKARGHINLGIAYREKGLTDKAIEQYRVALRLNPNYAEAHNNLGVAYGEKGLTDKAIEQYRVALRLNPNYADAHNNLGVAYGEKGLTDKAIEQYRVALRLNPGYVKAHTNLGVAYYRKGLTDQAIEEHRVALGLNPSYAEAHNNLGVAYDRKGLTDKAVEHYRIALQLDPDYAEAHNNLGVAYGKKDLTDKAVEHYRIALRLDPDYAEARTNLGVAYDRKGLIDKAIEQYRVALRLDPDSIEIRTNLGVAYDRKGLIDKAIEQYRVALGLDPDSIEIRTNLGVAYARKGLIDKAIEQYGMALGINPNYAEARTNLGVAYGRKGLIDRAIEEFEAAIRLNPDYVEAHINLGVAYGRKGLINEAISHYKEVVRLKPSSAITHYNLGLLYVKKGLLKNAIEEYQMALKYKPGFKEAQDNLNRALQSKNTEHEKMNNIPVY